MVEYVYARHDFAPEHEDEIAFRAGDRIEVIEKDDLYSDGWWQGRNLEGKVGLFPESYVQPAPPSTEPPAAPPATAPLTSALADKTQSSAASLPTVKPPQIDPVQEDTRQADTAPDTAQNQSTAAGNGEVMRATLTDVQQAIEQLGHKDDLDGSRSFTFSSTRDESTDRDTDLDTDVDVDGEDWHKSARQKLAEKAKKVVEEQAARDAIDGRVTLRSTAPPIDVELSDDSGDEVDGLFGHSSPPNGHAREHPHIPEDEEVDITAPRPQVDQKRAYSPSIQPSERYIVPSPISPVPHPESGPVGSGTIESAVATATQPSFPQNARVRTPENKSSLPSPVSPGLRGISNGVSADAAARPSSAQLVFPSKSQTLSLQEATGVLPSPAASSNGHRHGYSISSMTSSALNAPSPPLSAPLSSDFSAIKKPRDIHPSEWNVEEVIDWLHSKGFDDTVCDKFMEQEITGDVLLELDVGVLKSEIGIVAYGKRIRIANAISELRRPPSIMSSEQPTRSASLSQGSPLAQLSHSPATLLSTGFGALTSPESPSDLAESAEQPTEPPLRGSDPGVRPKAMESDVTVGLGLGIPSSLLVRNAEGKPVKGRPPQLSLSPSDPELAANAKGVAVEQRYMDEDRGVLSDSDTKNVAAKGRGHLFGRQNSTSSLPRKSQEVTTPRSDLSQSDSAWMRPQPRKRSLDATREGSRLSIFGGAFAGTLGKARKPPPRYSATSDVDASPDRSGLSLSRFYHNSGSRKSSTRSTPVDASHGKGDKHKRTASKDSSILTQDKRDPMLLRKPISPTTSTNTRGGSVKSDRNILEQIGEPDHKGWLRKRGDRYNAWKSRFFVLKGPHLYWLKSGNASETKIKGYLNIIGFRVVTDENIDPGRYGFKLVHDADKPHFFSSDEQIAVREWMKAFMKATIERDYSRPVVSSVNVPTIPLAVAQAMNPAPRPPSPTARAATQRAMRRENTNQLSTRDAEILMSLGPTGPGSDKGGNRLRINSFFSELATEAPVVPSISPTLSPPPVRPPREMRRAPSTGTTEHPPVEPELIEWANSHLPGPLQINSSGSICGGLELLRIAESIKGVRGHIAPDSAFPRGMNDDSLEGLFSLFDFLLDNDVKMGMISINDVRQGKRDKIIQLLKALRAWEDKRRAVLQSIGKSSMQAGPFVA